MYSLSISTSGKYISVAIHDDKLISTSSVLSENGTTNLLMKSIEEITKKSGIEKSDINVVYLDIGPGYYTSLRIGLAVAKRIKSLENLLIGKSIKDELTSIILNYNYENYLSPINDIRATNTYRFKASKVLVKDTIIKTINKFNLKG